MLERKRKLRVLREGSYAAEALVEFHYADESWSPSLSMDGARNLEAVRLALRRGDIAKATQYGSVFELKPVAAE